MQNISILKVESPSCLWGRLSGRDSEDLQLKMNLLYNDVSLQENREKPSSIEEGKVYVLYWSVKRCWCRAMVESVLQGSVTIATQVCCFLIDYGEPLVVTSDKIRTARLEFLQVPFLVRRYSLAGISPTTLKLFISEEKARLIPANQWDSSATRYLHNMLQGALSSHTLVYSSATRYLHNMQGLKFSVDFRHFESIDAIYEICVSNNVMCNMLYKVQMGNLTWLRLEISCMLQGALSSHTLVYSSDVRYLHNMLRASTRMEAVLKDEAEDSCFIDLYLTVQEVKICVNDDLVAKRFANYSSEVTRGSARWLQVVDQTPVMLACDIFTDTDRFLASSGCVVRSYFTPPRTNVGQQSPRTTITPLRTTKDQRPTIATITPATHNISPRTTKHVSLGRRPADSGPVDLMTVGTALQKNPDRRQYTKDEEDMSKLVPDRGCVWPFGGLAYSERRGEEDESTQDNEDQVFHTRETPSTPGSEEERACIRLLEWLNPEPVPDPSDKCVDSDPCSDGVLLHSSIPIEPCTSLTDAPITDHLRRILVHQQYSGPGVCERYSWPALARGCDTIVISSNANHPLSYLPPLLTHLQLVHSPHTLSSHSGPLAVILCTGWEKAQTVADLLEDLQAKHTFRPITVLLGVAKDEAKTVKIPRNCLLLVTTPFSLARLLACHCFLFRRLCHLILDQADQLFLLAPEQMATILQHFQKVTSVERWASFPRQVTVVARFWSSHFEGILANHMSSPCVVIAQPQEAALYAGVHQMTLLATESTKMSVLLGALDFNPDIGQKTLIVTSSAEEVDQVFKVIKVTSALCLRAHHASTHLFEDAVQQWRKNVGSGMHVIMVTTDEGVKALGVRDATCVVHYSFPSTCRRFGTRLFSMMQNFPSMLDKHGHTLPSKAPSSLLLISERNSRHILGVLRYLRRTEALLPPEMLSFAQGVLLVREKGKTCRPLCTSLKSFGVCRNGSACPDRHRFNSQQLQSLLPASGVITVLPLYIKTASVYFGRIISQPEGCFEKMASEMSAYYSRESLSATELVAGGLYALREDQIYHRVRVLCAPERCDGPFFRVPVRLVDEGREQEVGIHKLRQLPLLFRVLPEQAVEMVLCLVQPVDSEPTWNPEVTRTIRKKIQGVPHQARAVLSIGNTVFLDSMVKVSRVPGLKTVIYDYNVHREILNTGKGTSNPDHLDLLKGVCQKGDADTNHTSRLGSPGSMEVLASACREDESIMDESLSRAEPHNLDESRLDKPHNLDESRLDEPHNLDESRLDEPHNLDESRLDEPHNLDESRLVEPHNLDESIMDESLSRAEPHNLDELPGLECLYSRETDLVNKPADGGKTRSLHPQVRWYQRTDYLVVKIKLINPEQQHCDFYSNRVVYSGTIGGRVYGVDLGLSATIAAASCSWEMNCNEPVLRLVKEPPGRWNQLLQHKNRFVSYDLEYCDEEETEEEAARSGVRFVEATGEECSYVLDSQSDSDTDSDTE